MNKNQFQQVFEDWLEKQIVLERKLTVCKENDSIYNRAVEFACQRHSKQRRKASPWPYIVHIYEVSQILQEHDADMYTLIAGVLHDTVEDTGTTLEEIHNLFGEKVKEYVDVLSEDKHLPYKERKAIQAMRIANAPYEAKMIKCADCLSNIRSIYFDGKRSEDVWSKFNSSKENIKEHYKATIEAISELKDLNMFKKLTYYYKEVFGENIMLKTPTENNKNKTMLKNNKFPCAMTRPKACTECMFMVRTKAPTSHNYLNEEEYSCKLLNRTLRTNEKHPAPEDCPLMGK